MAAPPTAVHAVFGRRLGSDFPFRAPLAPAVGPGPPELTFRRDDRPLPAGAIDWSADRLARQAGAGLRLGRSGGDHVLRSDGGRIDFLVGAGRIVAHAAPATPDWLVELRLLGPVMAFWLEAAAGAVALHAAAVEIGGRAVAILAGNRAGKTSLALALVAAGHRLLADDLVAVERADDGAPRVPPAYPFVRLEPEDAERWAGGAAAGLRRAHPGFAKRIVPLTAAAGLAGSFAAGPAGLAALVLPERGGTAGPRFEPLSPAAAAVAVSRLSAAPRLAAAAGLGAARLERIGALCERVPAWRLGCPDGLDRLPEVAARLAERTLAAAPPALPPPP